MEVQRNTDGDTPSMVSCEKDLDMDLGKDQTYTSIWCWWWYFRNNIIEIICSNYGGLGSDSK